MKYRILYIGRNKGLIKELIQKGENDFEALSCSTNASDITNHINLIMPKALVYCMSTESEDDLVVIATLRQLCFDKKIMFTITGSGDDCDKIERLLPFASDLELRKPVTEDEILDRLKKRIDERENHNPANDLTADAVKPDKKRVLVVDDDPLMLRLIKEQLSEIYEIAAAPSGSVALKFLETKDVDLVLLDYEMPEMSGPFVLRAIRESENHKDLPVIFLTGVNDKEKIKSVIQLNPQGYVLKPIDKEKLIAAIDKAIN